VRVVGRTAAALGRARRTGTMTMGSTIARRAERKKPD
jgi:hypothetical protein